MGNCPSWKKKEVVKQISRYRYLSPEWDVTVEPPEGYFIFTVGEAVVLREKWLELTEGEAEMRFGTTIFSKLFDAIPEISQFFFAHQCEDFLENKLWEHHPLFRSHMHRVMDGINTAVMLCDDPYPRQEYGETLESFHSKIMDMKKVYVEVFVKVIDDTLMESLGEEVYDGECKRAFRKLLHMLYYHITLKVEVVRTTMSALGTRTSLIYRST